MGVEAGEHLIDDDEHVKTLCRVGFYTFVDILVCQTERHIFFEEGIFGQGEVRAVLVVVVTDNLDEQVFLDLTFAFIVDGRIYETGHFEFRRKRTHIDVVLECLLDGRGSKDRVIFVSETQCRERSLNVVHDRTLILARFELCFRDVILDAFIFGCLSCHRYVVHIMEIDLFLLLIGKGFFYGFGFCLE